MNIPKEALERMKNSINEENKLLEEMKILIQEQLEGLKVNFRINKVIIDKQEEEYMKKKTFDVEKRLSKGNEFKSF